MIITRRAFLDYCAKAVGTCGFAGLHLASIEEALANPSAAPVIWLQGASCSGCSVSFLNYVSPVPPVGAADVLIASINLLFHPGLMGAQGELVRSVIQNALSTGGYVLAVEGGIPTAFGGHACTVWDDGTGTPITAKDAVISLAAQASRILSIGTCASWGGVPGVAPNPSVISSVSGVTGRSNVNIAGCPPHPNWIVWGIVNAIANTIGPLDAQGRPQALFSDSIHACDPREPNTRVTTYGQDYCCQRYLGCRGPVTYGPCALEKWNNGVNWCTDANTICIGCVNHDFPRTVPLRLPTS
jgi:hydrogenase small subunit